MTACEEDKFPQTQIAFAPKAESFVDTPDFKYAVTQKEEDFAQFIAIGVLPTEAVIRAAIVTQKEAERMDRAALYKMSNHLQKSKGVQERITYFHKLHRLSISTTVERMEQELAAMAYADFALLFHPEDGPIEEVQDPFSDDPDATRKQHKWRAGDPIRNPHDLPRHIRAAVKEWAWDKDGNLKVKFHDKTKAMQMIGDLNGYFNEAHAAKAPQISVSIGDGGGNLQQAIDVTPEPELPECLS